MARHIALLRGVNLGPHKRVAMTDLRAALTAAGFGDVVTHLQSGNVVLDSPLPPAKLGPAVEAVVEDALGLRSDVIVRSPAQLAAAITADPFGDEAPDPARHVLGFLAAEPPADKVAAIEERIAELPSDGDRHAFHGKHFYLWCPNGISKSPYLKVPWDRLGVSSTQRNWNTVTALSRLAAR
jgi:uncharacterized protein (DUF1697 family)